MRFRTHSQRSRARGAVAAAALASVAMLGRATPAHAVTGAISNPLSAFPIEADGAYTNAGEWSDITPAWFISTSSGATPTFAGNASANSLLFAGLSRDTPTSTPELYLMYDYLPRTVAPSAPNQFLGSVSFPVDIASSVNGVSTSTNITVTLQTSANFPSPDPGFTSFFDVFVDLHDGNGPQLDSSGSPLDTQLGLEAGVGPGTTPVNALWGVTATSPFHTTVHELLELGVPLDIPAGFGTPGGPFSQGGSGGGNGYSPDPAFWNSDLPDNSGDPPASAGLFQINPDGSTLIHPAAFSAPEPTTLGLLALSGILLGVRRTARKIR